MKSYRMNKTALQLILIMLAVNLAFTLSAVAFPRSVQLWCFVLLPAVLMLFLADKPLGRRVAAGIAATAQLLSVVDTGFRGFLQATYQSDFLSGFVVESVANTNSSEAIEYVWTVLPDALMWTGLTLVVLLVEGWAIKRYLAGGGTTARVAKPLAVVLLAVVVLLGSAGWLIKPWRNQYPVVSWMTFMHRVEAFQADWADAKEEMQEGKNKAAVLFGGVDKQANTIVLVVGESMNRNNMSVYGYGRDTTPRLAARAKEDDRLNVVQDVWSVDASTIASFNSMFKFPSDDAGKERDMNVLALFKHAGYHITWISNQDDLAIKSDYMAWADDTVILNLMAGRSTQSLDEKVVPALKKALARPDAKRLVVVHLLGIHPHFSLRYTDAQADLWTQKDDVARDMNAKGRSSGTIESRNEYDRAMRYQDAVIDETLTLTQAEAKAPTTWIFISDHSVETGHDADKTGHSQTTAGGYTIPMLYWSNESRDKAAATGYRTDWLSHFLLDRAGIRWKNERLDRSLSSERYRWTAPDSKKRFEGK